MKITSSKIVCLILLCSFALCLNAVSVADTPMKVEPNVAEGVAWYDAAKWPTEGQCWTDVARRFARIPDRVKDTIPKSVWALSQHSPGLLVRFKTDSTVIRVRFKLSGASLSMPHMPATGMSGLDLYIRKDNKWNWAGCTRPVKQEDTQALVGDMEPTMKECMIYFPLYNGIDRLEIGVSSKSTFIPVAPRKEKPVFYYGTSIAQGGCSSRPGMTTTALLGRRLDMPVVNFGFSGSACMEPEIATLIAEVDPSVYVLDALPNMSPEQTATRCVPFIKILRQAHPTTPILLVEDRSFSNAWVRPLVQKTHVARRKGLKDAYDYFIAQGDKNIYYLDAKNLIGEDLDYDSTMDASHLNDLGMYRMTNSIEKALRPILKK